LLSSQRLGQGKDADLLLMMNEKKKGAREEMGGEHIPEGFEGTSLHPGEAERVLGKFHHHKAPSHLISAGRSFWRIGKRDELPTKADIGDKLGGRIKCKVGRGLVVNVKFHCDGEAASHVSRVDIYTPQVKRDIGG
jgi:hypothetical protein